MTTTRRILPWWLCNTISHRAADLGGIFAHSFSPETFWLPLLFAISRICFLMNSESYKNCDMNIGSEGANSWLCFDLFGANASSSASAREGRSFDVKVSCAYSVNGGGRDGTRG